MRKTMRGLQPVDDTGNELVDALALGDVVRVKVTRPRNIHHHRKFWALMQLVYQNQEHYQSIDHMVAAVKVATGHSDALTTKTSDVIYLPKSIAFHKMDQQEFSQFYERVLDLIVKSILPGIDKAELRDEVETFL